MAKVQCDRLTVSVPQSHDAALLDVANEFAVALDCAPSPRVEGLWFTPGGGTLMYQVKSRFASVEASGQALAALRGLGLFGDYLQALGALPSRVTRLDANLDVVVRAAPVLHRIYRKGRDGGISLGRKSLPGSLVTKVFSSALYPEEPQDTGTVYLPLRKAASLRQYALVYDKRQERIGKGYPDPGPLLRYEAIAARGKGATLQDAWDPAALFYDIMSPDILSAPSGMPEWTPAAETWQGKGFAPALPLRRLQRYLDGPGGAALLDLASFEGGLAEIREWVTRVETGRALAGAGSGVAQAPAQQVPAA